MQLINRGTVESRLRVLRYGLIAVNVAWATLLIGTAAVVWSGVGNVKDKVEGIDYSFGDYLGDVGTYLVISIAIVLVASLVIYFVYASYLKRRTS